MAMSEIRKFERAVSWPFRQLDLDWSRRRLDGGMLEVTARAQVGRDRLVMVFVQPPGRTTTFAAVRRDSPRAEPIDLLHIRDEDAREVGEKIARLADAFSLLRRKR